MLPRTIKTEYIESSIFSVSTPYYYDDIDTSYVHIMRWNGGEFEDFLDDVPFIPGIPSAVIIGDRFFYPCPVGWVEEQELLNTLTPEEYRHDYLDWQPCKLSMECPKCE